MGRRLRQLIKREQNHEYRLSDAPPGRAIRWIIDQAQTTCYSGPVKDRSSVGSAAAECSGRRAARAQARTHRGSR
ncbi:hypothetical protein EVAR_48725_1 [Eumeta japonica]|uniref:Uncharacterized protein n=1 Tax=Eumeta variegata TaxID=151549 RepID=A0A4C1T345_EUMVA|nr:hypothetical protein EVAR_48725_1 [Eumeta japonica]